MITYHMSCGCEVPEIKIVKGGRRNNQCPEHPSGKTKYRSKDCETCGVHFKIKSRTKDPDNCPACKENIKLLKDKLKWKNRPADFDYVLHFACGCSILRSKASHLRVDGHLRLACAKHKEPVTKRTSSCLICKKEFEAGPHSKMATACIPCRESLGIEITVERKEQTMYVPSAASQASVNRIDCIHRSNCTAELFFSKAKFLPCLNCNKYMSTSIHVEPGVYKNHDQYLYAGA